MSLSLNASKKNIQTLFDSGELQYVIPYYQRPYSWEYAQVNQMYADIVNAYRAKEEYFLGNILLAISVSEANSPRVIDGQQRLITIWLMLKVISTLLPKHTNLSRLICAQSLFNTADQNIERVQYQLKESHDLKMIEEISAWSEADMMKRWNQYSKNDRISERLCPSFIEANCLYLYNWFNNFKRDAGEDGLTLFLKFLLDNVYLLPIEMSGNTPDIATSRALKIYESMNNRGMNLSDADIFKARLYAKASNKKEEEVFIDQWVDLSNSCADLSISIDEVFRYYMHIIRGEKGIIVGETSLRDFFTMGVNPPLDVKEYDGVMRDMTTIIDILRQYKAAMSSKHGIAKWLKVVDWYTNQYPKIALVTYLYHNGVDEIYDKEFLRLTKGLIRYCFGMGSTTVVKFEIYNVIKQVSKGITFSDYYDKNVSIDNFNYLGSLKKGFALLTYLIRNATNEVSEYSYDRILRSGDADYIKQYWPPTAVDFAMTDLANYFILRKEDQNWVIDDKRVKELMSSKPMLDYQDFAAYSEELKKSLVNFFKGE